MTSFGGHPCSAESAKAIELTKKAWTSVDEAKKLGTSSSRKSAVSALREAVLAHINASETAQARGHEEAAQGHKIVASKLQEAIANHQLPRHFNQKNVAGRLNLDFAYQHLKNGGSIESATDALMKKSGIGRSQARMYAKKAASKLV